MLKIFCLIIFLSLGLRGGTGIVLAQVESKPKALGVFYGWPSSFGSTPQLAYTNKFNQFDMVVFGACIETPSHGAHAFTSDLVAILKANGKEVFGYVDLGISKYTKEEREKRIDAWKAMGEVGKRVDGIFFDDFGVDYTGAGVGSWCGSIDGTPNYYSAWTPSETKTNMIEGVDYVHSSGLKVFANSWGWNEDVNGTLLPKLLRDGDLIMAESLVAFNGTLYSSDGTTPLYQQYDDRIAWKNNSALWPTVGKVRIGCISTMATNSTPNPSDPLYKLSVAGAIALGCDLDQIAETNYGSSTNELAGYSIPSELANVDFITSGGVSGVDGVYTRAGTRSGSGVTLNLDTRPGLYGFTVVGGGGLPMATPTPTPILTPTSTPMPIPVGANDRVMTVNTPNYSDNGQTLNWNGRYNSAFSGLAAGLSPSMKIGETEVCWLSFSPSDPVFSSVVSAYDVNPSLDVDFSVVLNQDAWYQVAGGGVRSKAGISDRIPVTCAASLGSCANAISIGASWADGGLVAAAAPINKGCPDCTYGIPPNDWHWSGDLMGINQYNYTFFTNGFAGLALTRTFGVGTSLSQIGIGTTGVVLVNGDVTIDVDNMVSQGDFLMVVAKRNIDFMPNVNNSGGVFVADGNINIGGSSSSDTALTINGVVYSGAGEVNIVRSFANMGINNTTPAVVFKYRPDFIFSMPTNIMRIISGWNYN